MSGPINEVAILLKTSVIRPLKQLALIIDGFQLTNSYGPCMYNNYIANAVLHTFKL